MVSLCFENYFFFTLKTENIFVFYCISIITLLK